MALVNISQKRCHQRLDTLWNSWLHQHGEGSVLLGLSGGVDQPLSLTTFLNGNVVLDPTRFPVMLACGPRRTVCMPACA
jgi:hypothetical protein